VTATLISNRQIRCYDWVAALSRAPEARHDFARPRSFIPSEPVFSSNPARFFISRDQIRAEIRLRCFRRAPRFRNCESPLDVPVGRVFTGGATTTRGVARCQRRRLRPRHSRLEISLALKTLAPRPPARPRTASCRRTSKVDRRIPETIPRRCRGCSPCA
jgi:hypothetical protein